MKKTRRDLWDAGMFPVLLDNRYDSEGLASVPLWLVLPHEAQAQSNHGQTLKRLAERGGLSPAELAAVLEDRRFERMEVHEAWAAIFRSAARIAAPEVPRG